MADVSRSPLAPAIERARALIASGDLGPAQVLLERAVELGRENLGEGEPDVLTAQCELAGVLLQSDDPMAARRVLEEAYAAGQWRLGDGHSIMLRISHDLGIVAQELGNRHEARKAFGRVAAAGPAALGEGHEFVVRARSYLGADSSGAAVRPEAPSGLPVPVPDVVPVPPPGIPVVDELSAVRTDDPVSPVAGLPTPAGVEVNAGGAVLDAGGAMPNLGEAVLDAGGVGVNAAGMVPVVHRPGAPESRRTGPPDDGLGAYQGGYHIVDDPYGVHQGGYPQQRHGAGHSTGWPASPQQESGAGGPYRSRGLAVGLTVVATLAALVAVGSLVVVLTGRGGGEPVAPVVPVATASAGVPRLAGDPPTGVKLVDRGSSIEVSWRDPSGGKVPFIITMARKGQRHNAMADAELGRTRMTLSGLNPKLEYCFAVVAVYSSDRMASSNQVCLGRE